MSLGVVFAILDTNVSNQITLSEFNSHIKKMPGMNLDYDEIMSLFKFVDANNSGSISYDELVEKFSYFNTQQLLKRISVFIMSGKSNADFIFDKYAKDGVRMSFAEFSIMVKTFLKSVSSPEVL